MVFYIEDLGIYWYSRGAKLYEDKKLRTEVLGAMEEALDKLNYKKKNLFHNDEDNKIEFIHYTK